MAALIDKLNSDFDVAMVDWRAAIKELKVALEKKDYGAAKILARRSSSALERAAAVQVALMKELSARFE